MKKHLAMTHAGFVIKRHLLSMKKLFMKVDKCEDEALADDEN